MNVAEAVDVVETGEHLGEILEGLLDAEWFSGNWMVS